MILGEEDGPISRNETMWRCWKNSKLFDHRARMSSVYLVVVVAVVVRSPGAASLEQIDVAAVPPMGCMKSSAACLFVYAQTGKNTNKRMYSQL